MSSSDLSSSDLASSDKSAESKATGGPDKDELESLADSIDASLDAILSEAKEVAQPAATEGEATVAATDPAAAEAPPPPAEVQMALVEGSTGSEVLGDDQETPLPVIVEDDEPSYKAFADMVAPTEEPKAAAETAPETPAPVIESPPLEAAAEEMESGEILDADELIDSMTPGPQVIEQAEAAVAAEPAGSLTRTEESQSYTPPPPSDQELLDKVVLPPGSTPMPMPLQAQSSDEPAAQPGLALDDDKTVISPMPPMPEPSVQLPPPRRLTSAWAAPASEETSSVIIRSEGTLSKLKKAAGSRVHASVGAMVVVVIAAAFLGGVGVKMFGSSGAKPAVSSEPARTEAPAAPAVATPTPTPAPAADPSPAAEKPAVAEKAPEKAAAPAKPAAKPAAKPPTQVALAAPAAKPAAPAKKPAAAPKPAAKKPAAPATAWVDPFGQ